MSIFKINILKTETDHKLLVQKQDKFSINS